MAFRSQGDKEEAAKTEEEQLAKSEENQKKYGLVEAK